MIQKNDDLIIIPMKKSLKSTEILKHTKGSPDMELLLVPNQLGVQIGNDCHVQKLSDFFFRHEFGSKILELEIDRTGPA